MAYSTMDLEDTMANLEPDFKDLSIKILKKGQASRVIFFYPGDEGSLLENAAVTVFENGIVHIFNRNEETTSHIQNVEIIWRMAEPEEETRSGKVRLLRPRSEPESENGPLN